MISIYIYVESEQKARQLVLKLMEERLLAHASIDKDNTSFIYKDGQITEEENYVINAQTKALLFNEIVKLVADHSNNTIKIYSLPITQCNKPFEQIIRETTKSV